MNKILNKLEKSIGRFAIPNLIRYLIICYAIGFIFKLIAPGIFEFFKLDPYLITKGQVWRIVSWLLIPPSMGTSPLTLFFNLIMLMFYYLP